MYPFKPINQINTPPLISYSLFLWLHHSNLPLFLNWKNKERLMCVCSHYYILSLMWDQGKKTKKSIMFIRAFVIVRLRGLRTRRVWVLYTWGLDGVHKWIAICLTPADREDVEGVHMNYQLWHGLLQSWRKTHTAIMKLFLLHSPQQWRRCHIQLEQLEKIMTRYILISFSVFLQYTHTYHNLQRQQIPLDFI